jgi:hypothetical protein
MVTFPLSSLPYSADSNYYFIASASTYLSLLTQIFRGLAKALKQNIDLQCKM